MTDGIKNKAHKAYEDQQARDRQKIKAIQKRLGVPQPLAQGNTRKPGKRIDVYYALNRIKQNRQQQQDRSREQVQEHNKDQSKDKGKSL